MPLSIAGLKLLHMFQNFEEKFIFRINNIRRYPSLSELTPIIIIWSYTLT